MAVYVPGSNRVLAPSCAVGCNGGGVVSSALPLRESAMTQPAAVQAHADAEAFGKVFQRNWEGGLLVARSVELGTPGRPPKNGENSPFSKVSARAFAEWAGVHHSTVTAYLKNWEKAAACGVVPGADTLMPGQEIPLAGLPSWDGPFYPPLPDGQFSVFYADPPWQYDFAESDSRKIENQYETLTADQLVELGNEIQPMAADDSVLYMWATNPKLREALRVVAAWGFEYVTGAVWIKDKIGMGYYFRQRHELLLVGKRGDFPVPEPENRPDSVIEAPRGKHSAKPALVYELLEAMYGDQPKVELFSRSQRPGWESWGNEVPS